MYKKSISKSAKIGVTMDTLVRQDEVVTEDSALSRVSDLKGMLSGPEDLSVSRSYLKNFGRQVIPTLSPD